MSTINKEIFYEFRPWGSYYNIVDSSECKVKKLIVNPRSRLSYQYHKLRDEKWIVVKGIATVTIDDVESEIGYSELITIPRMSKHRLENKNDEELVIIEIQTGDYFGEDDIVRIEDDYGRI